LGDLAKEKRGVRKSKKGTAEPFLGLLSTGGGGRVRGRNKEENRDAK